MKNIAIFGGTFDPLHLGHLNLATKAVEACDLDRLYFMPNYVSPFKKDKKVTSGEMRCDMVESILHYNEAFRVCYYEIGLEGPSYTYDTLDHFRSTLEAKMFFLLGFDSILDIDTWYRGPDLLREFSFLTGVRPGSDTEKGFAKIAEYEEKYGADIRVIDLDPFDASSTEIRKAVKEGRSIDAYVAPEIRDYIYEHGLYL